MSQYTVTNMMAFLHLKPALFVAICCHCRRNRDAQLRATINQKLIETGERDRYICILNLGQCFQLWM